MMTINLNQIPTEYIMRTKAGKLWRCGKGYRKNWAKLMNKVVLLHNKAFTLLNRVKEEGKWYLVFTDGTNNYTERQDKALHNKHLAKDTIIEAVKRVIAGLLPAPKELIDQLLEEADLIKANTFHSPGSYPFSEFWKNTIRWFPKDNNEVGLFKNKLIYVMDAYKDVQEKFDICRNLMLIYHPDRSNYPIEYSQAIADMMTSLHRGRAQQYAQANA